MDSNYLIYNFVNIEDSLKPNNYFSSSDNNCIEICNSETNCQGVNITKPKCESDNISDPCVKSNITNGIGGTEPKNLTNFNCVFLKNINNTNYIGSSENNDSWIKKHYGNNLNNISLDKKYYLKINGKYIGIENKKNQIFLTYSNDLTSGSFFQFNSNGNLIETKTGKCIQTNGNYLILKDCIQDDVTQEFIYESKSNTIRPITNNANNNLCFSLGTNMQNQNESNNIVLEECNYTNNKNQSVETELNPNPNPNAKSVLEPFYSKKNDLNELKEINFCSNSIYKTIVTFILCCILIYFIWYLIRKKYKDDTTLST
jgi:hypothetical protein